jgi:hypothetical protein
MFETAVNKYVHESSNRLLHESNNVNPNQKKTQMRVVVNLVIDFE